MSKAAKTIKSNRAITKVAHVWEDMASTTPSIAKALFVDHADLITGAYTSLAQLENRMLALKATYKFNALFSEFYKNTLSAVADKGTVEDVVSATMEWCLTTPAKKAPAKAPANATADAVALVLTHAQAGTLTDDQRAVLIAALATTPAPALV